jgi:bifunctional DNA-binding transcriptional regulator/antitoxin component of YhaV-PrlF toxin-antitoxin module
MLHCSIVAMSIAVPVSKRGTVTLPPEIRKKMGIDQLENPIVLINELDGKFIMEPATAVPVRDIPLAKLHQWIKQDEEEMAAYLESQASKG